MIGVYAAEVHESVVRLNAAEHAECQWLSYEESLQRVHYRGLKDGLRSVQEYITGPAAPARELCLYSADAA
jgi:NADH pyrophosphatase NudC (nudix superfamily)